MSGYKPPKRPGRPVFGHLEAVAFFVVVIALSFTAGVQVSTGSAPLTARLVECTQ